MDIGSVVAVTSLYTGQGKEFREWIAKNRKTCARMFVGVLVTLAFYIGTQAPRSAPEHAPAVNIEPERKPVPHRIVVRKRVPRLRLANKVEDLERVYFGTEDTVTAVEAHATGEPEDLTAGIPDLHTASPPRAELPRSGDTSPAEKTELASTSTNEPLEFRRSEPSGSVQ